MQVSEKEWLKYVKKLSAISKTAAAKMQSAIHKYGVDDRETLIDIAYSLAQKYGSASGAMACTLYDDVARLSRVYVPDAEMAELATKKEIETAISTAPSAFKMVDVVTIYVKMASLDTIQQNARRDHAQWAWIPSGDSCPFCMTLASRGWVNASDEVKKGNHAEHVHANCDCTFAIRFNDKTTYEGYNPQVYLDKYYAAEGKSSKDKINSMRREEYQQNKDEINARKRELYALNKEKEE